jgi:hypothetical protein
VVWDIIQHKLPPLHAHATALLSEADSSGGQQSESS